MASADSPLKPPAVMIFPLKIFRNCAAATGTAFLPDIVIVAHDARLDDRQVGELEAVQLLGAIAVGRVRIAVRDATPLPARGNPDADAVGGPIRRQAAPQSRKVKPSVPRIR